MRHSLPVVFLVLADRQWGMVKFSQSMALDAGRMTEERTLPPGTTLGTDFEEIRFDELARSMGAHGERVFKKMHLEPGA